MVLEAVVETNLPGLARGGRGRGRAIYEIGDKLLLVASDRLSAFDVVLPDGIPGKGKVLTQISAFWFRKLADIVPNHMLTIDPEEFPPTARAHEETIAGRSMLCRKAKPLPVESRGRGEVCGTKVPGGLLESARLPEPIFPPATKEEKGKHDVNIPFAKMVDVVGKPMAEKARAVSLEIYRRAADYARGRGIIIADTKFEFGLANGKLILIDEVLTPDSSRFWPAGGYREILPHVVLSRFSAYASVEQDRAGTEASRRRDREDGGKIPGGAENPDGGGYRGGWEGPPDFQGFF